MAWMVAQERARACRPGLNLSNALCFVYYHVLTAQLDFYDALHKLAHATCLPSTRCISATSHAPIARSCTSNIAACTGGNVRATTRRAANTACMRNSSGRILVCVTITQPSSSGLGFLVG